jgi:hypothetical protein
VDIGILTARPNEFRAVLDAFPARAGVFKSTSCEYTRSHRLLQEPLDEAATALGTDRLGSRAKRGRASWSASPRSLS